MSIDHIHLRRFDLNLLLAFDALMESCSVSKAAARLSIGQSAMSHALRRLRDLFGDPILVREAGGFVPTDKALALWQPVRRALEDLEQGLTHAQSFDPAREYRIFSISIPDYVAALFGPELVRHARKHAPSIAYRIESLGRSEGFVALAEGRIDAMIGVADPPMWTISERLFSDGFSTLYDHKRWQRPPSDLEAFCRAPHALASQTLSFEGWVDEALTRLNRRRHVVFSAARFADAAACVQGSDLLLTLPTAAAQSYAGLFELSIVQAPLELREFDVLLFRRARSKGAPDSEWLAATLRAVSAHAFDLPCQ